MWNKENRFTGWTDVDLSAEGVARTIKSGQLLKESGYEFDLAYTSVLKRAIRTLWIVLDKMDLMWIPIYKSWRLNERHYGALQGLDKSETAIKYGKETVDAWRRSYQTKPPPLKPSDPRRPLFNKVYDRLDDRDLPGSESLEDTSGRLLPYWEKTITPEILSGKRIIISAHGNSLRALIKHLEHISDKDISRLEIRPGVPLIYELDHRLDASAKCYLEEGETDSRSIAGSFVT